MIRNNNVKVAGFRLQGPTAGQGSGEDNSEMGIRIWPFQLDTPIARIQISNMEVSRSRNGPAAASVSATRRAAPRRAAGWFARTSRRSGSPATTSTTTGTTRKATA